MSLITQDYFTKVDIFSKIWRAVIVELWGLRGPHTECLQKSTIPLNKFSSKKLHPQLISTFNWWNTLLSPSYNFLLSYLISNKGKTLKTYSNYLSSQVSTLGQQGTSPENASVVYFNADLRPFWENRKRAPWFV